MSAEALVLGQVVPPVNNEPVIPFGEDISHQPFGREFDMGALACVQLTASNNDDCILDGEDHGPGYTDIYSLN